MPTTSDKHRGRIAKLMSDPRYWNDSHPEHPQVVADAQRAFKDAYPESSSDDQTSTGTVHVRAYTRTVDGKEIDVSAYDRTQLVAFHPPTLPERGQSPYLQDIAESQLHKDEKERLVTLLRSRGYTVETEVTLVGFNGVKARPDIIAMSPEGGLLAYEVKTSAYDLFSPGQWTIYPLLDQGEHVFSRSSKIRSFGFEPGQPLPAMCVYASLVSPGKLGRGFIPLSPDPRCRPPGYEGPVWSWER